MSNEINIRLRSEILGMALTLESSINDLITSFLKIEHPDPKAISNKSSSLSFKSKLDLLGDLEIVSKDEYSNLLLVMEFRNQFLHNINCDSFIKAVSLLGDDRGKRLLKFDNLDFEVEQEFRYNNAYSSLFINCLDIILNRYDQRWKRFVEKKEIFLTVSEYIEYLLDTDQNIILEIMEICMPHLTDDTQLKEFKSKLSSIISEGQESSLLTDKYKQLKDRLDAIDSIKISEFFKRTHF